jgi:pimeloyl-ACP methyl ester carboxylesterase
MADSELRALPDCAHMPTREYPEEFNRLIRGVS